MKTELRSTRRAKGLNGECGCDSLRFAVALSVVVGYLAITGDTIAQTEGGVQINGPGINVNGEGENCRLTIHFPFDIEFVCEKFNVAVDSTPGGGGTLKHNPPQNSPNKEGEATTDPPSGADPKDGEKQEGESTGDSNEPDTKAEEQDQKDEEELDEEIQELLDEEIKEAEYCSDRLIIIGIPGVF